MIYLVFYISLNVFHTADSSVHIFFLFTVQPDNMRLLYWQLSSLYDSKPPVSRAKMASITKTALKAVKFYKHVVQSVEKFILKVPM